MAPRWRAIRPTRSQKVRWWMRAMARPVSKATNFESGPASRPSSSTLKSPSET